MDTYEQAALLDFVQSIVWPSRTVAIATAGQTDFPVLGTWDVANDVAIAWINGQRFSGTLTWLDASTVQLSAGVAAGSQVIIYTTPGAGTGYLARSGLAAMLGTLDMDSFQIENLGASTQGHHAVRRDEVQAIAAALLGANYLLKSGGTMSGALLLRAAGTFAASEAVRRDMVALLDGTQPFTGKQAGVSTVDGDPAATLTTKDFVLAKILAQASGSMFPVNQWIAAAAGDWNVDIPAGFSRVFVVLSGGGGGGGGGGNLDNYHGGAGGHGGYGGWIMPVNTAGETLAVRVGGGGGGGGKGISGDGRAGGGGGGGGASQVTGAAGVVTAGGGGGGGGGADDQNPTSNGGAGGVQGAAGNAGFNAQPGNSTTTAGGVGGAGPSSPGAGGAGGSGTVANPASLVLSPDFMVIYNQLMGGAGAGGTGSTGTNTDGTAGTRGTVRLFW